MFSSLRSDVYKRQAQCGQIHRAVAHHSRLDGGVPLALADHDLVAKIQLPGADVYKRQALASSSCTMGFSNRAQKVL